MRYSQDIPKSFLFFVIENVISICHLDMSSLVPSKVERSVKATLSSRLGAGHGRS
jgi:hypothetical protein